MRHRQDGLFPALLKQWRHKRGLSQLDLALAADVSSRHVSFLETGRSQPSQAMILKLATALDIPLRQVNTLLRAAHFEPLYPETFDPNEPFPDGVREAWRLLKHHHEPFPMIVVNRLYEVIDLNDGALTLLARVLGEELSLSTARRLNLLHATFMLARHDGPIVNFEEIGPWILQRLQREVLADPHDEALRALLDELASLPIVPEDWRVMDLTRPLSPTLALCLRVDGQELRFVTMLTTFQAPQTVYLDELKIETWLPQDERTAQFCSALGSA